MSDGWFRHVMGRAIVIVVLTRKRTRDLDERMSQVETRIKIGDRGVTYLDREWFTVGKFINFCH